MFLGMLLLINFNVIDSVEGECPLKILLNHVELSTVETGGTTFTYYYGEGDQVDVTCSSYEKFRIQLKYVYSNSPPETFETPVTLSPFPVAGIRVKLQAIHNNSLMTCECTGNVDNATIKFQFVMTDKFEDMFNVNINGLPVRVMIPKSDDKDIKLIYYYRPKESLDIACETSDMKTKLKWNICSSATNKVIAYQPTRSPLSFCAHDNTTNAKLEVVLQFKPLSAWLIDNTPLLMKTQPNKILFEIYTYKREHHLYYVYEDEDNLTLTCYTPPGVITSPNKYYVLNFNGTEESHKDNITKFLHLSSVDDNTEVECSLRSCRRGNGMATTKSTSRLIRVILRRKTTDIDNWSLLVVGGVLCVVLLCISLAVFTWKRNLHLQSRSGDRDPQCHTSIRYNPPRWGAHYTGPVGQGDDSTIYSEPWRPIVTISTTQGQVTTPELNYAALDISPSVGDPKTVKSEESPYAEVFFDISARVRQDDAHK